LLFYIGDIQREKVVFGFNLVRNMNKLSSLLLQMRNVFLLTMKYDPKILPKNRKYGQWSEYKITFLFSFAVSQSDKRIF
jgi:hypothetical protein